MPTYEYICNRCGKRFECFQPITARAGAKCPACGAAARRRISAGSGVIFKGTGFYETDYKRGKSAPPASGSASDGAADRKDRSEKMGEGTKNNGTGTKR